MDRTEATSRDILKEAVIKLRLPIGVYIDATKYCAQMKNSKTHNFAAEVLESASVYLATKVNEQYRRIRGSLLAAFILRYPKRGALHP